MSDNSSPKGILRNKEETESSPTFQDKLDRQEVIKNTRLNAQLTNEQQSKGDEIRAKIAEAKQQQGLDPTPEHLKWDEINLYKAEQDKSATMKIDEPKTPYENGFDPNGEYYQDDDDEQIPEFELGEGAKPEDVKGTQSMMGSEVLRNEEQEGEGAEEEEEDGDEESQLRPLTAEERHKKFEEMRKAHYHMKGSVLGKKIEVSDDED